MNFKINSPLRFKRKNIDTLILAVASLAPIFPTSIAKISVVIITVLFTMRMLTLKSITSHIAEKLIIFILLVPGALSGLLISGEHALVFIPISILLFGFPFKGFTFNINLIKFVMLLTIIYLIAGQVFIALDQKIFVEFRNFYYPIDENFWNYGSVDSILYEYRSFRAAGIFYNPNLYGLILVLYYIIFSTTSLRLRRWNDEKFRLHSLDFLVISFLVFFSLYLTGSRTALLSATVFLYLAILGPRVKIGNFLKRNWLILNVIFFAAITYFLTSYVLHSLVGVSESGTVKLRILINHILTSEVHTLILGGEFTRHFDQEIGYWLGAVGILGIVGLGLLFRMYYSRIPMTQPVVVSLLVASMGNSIFYGLLTGCIAIYIFVVLSSIHFSKI